MRFDDLLASLGERLGVEIEDAGGAAAMEVDGVPVILRDAGDILLLHTEVGEIPSDGRESILAAAMEANWLYEGTGGGTLAVNPADGCLNLEKYTWFDRLDPEDALSMIERFVATVETWRRILSDYHRAPSVDEPGKVPDLPYPPPGEFLPI